MNRLTPDKQVVAIVRGDQRYIFLFDDTEECRKRLQMTCGVFASDHELSFTWCDAALVMNQVRQLTNVKS